MEPGGKKGYPGKGRLLGKLSQHESGHFEALEGLVEPENQEYLSEVHPEVLDERMQQYFPAR